MLTFALFSNTLANSDFIEDGWKGIKLFKTHITTVEKILGQPKASRDNAYNYETNEFFIQVKYSNALCSEGRYGGGEYDVPLDTVISYRVIPNKETKLKALKFQREKYERQVDSEQNSLVHYINKSNAIMIMVIIVNGTEYLTEIDYDPSPTDRKNFECKKPEVTTDKTQKSKPIENQNCKKPQ